MKSLLGFFKALFSLRHIPSIVIFLLNFWVLLVFVFNFTHCTNEVVLVVSCLALTLAALAVVVSPVGDWWILKSVDSKMVKAEETDVAERVMPLFNEVMSEARFRAPDISENVRLYVAETDIVNAYAIGRRIVCLTRGTIDACDDETIRALLSHEFGHMAHRDSEVSLLICVGLLPLIVGEAIARSIMFGMAAIVRGMDNGLAGAIGPGFVKLMYYLVFGIPCWLLKVIINLLRTLGSHAAENGADAFCVTLGHGPALMKFMEEVSYAETKGSLLDSIFSSHPASAKRVRNIEKLIAMQG